MGASFLPSGLLATASDPDDALRVAGPDNAWPVHPFTILPRYTTGPVGAPVGDPPFGSELTSSSVPADMVTGILICPVTGITPRLAGATAPGGQTQSSSELPGCTSAALAMTVA